MSIIYAAKPQKLNPNKPKNKKDWDIWEEIETCSSNESLLKSQGWETSPTNNLSSVLFNRFHCPASVTSRQMKRALAQAGKLSLIEGYIASLPEPNKTVVSIEWKDSNEFIRTYPLLNNMALLMGMSQADLDQIFILASTL